jgi:hypothetical protein
LQLAPLPLLSAKLNNAFSSKHQGALPAFSVSFLMGRTALAEAKVLLVTA